MKSGFHWQNGGVSMIKIKVKDFYEDMDKYFKIASKEKIVVEIEDNKNIVILPEEEYKKLKNLRE